MVEPRLSAGGQAHQDEGCKHYWRIASPSGETSTGVCKICGASREFQNYSFRSTMSRVRKPTGGGSGRAAG